MVHDQCLQVQWVVAATEVAVVGEYWATADLDPTANWRHLRPSSCPLIGRYYSYLLQATL